jgi:hypothetical protein
VSCPRNKHIFRCDQNGPLARRSEPDWQTMVAFHKESFVATHYTSAQTDPVGAEKLFTSQQTMFQIGELESL